jgi:hypothetical protein
VEEKRSGVGGAKGERVAGLVDQTEDQQELTCFIPVHAGVVTGDLRISTRFIFLVIPPYNIPRHLTTTFERLQFDVIDALAIM